MVDKPLSFKAWLQSWYAIDYDKWSPRVTEVTKKVWHEGYERYLQDWEGKNDERNIK